MDHVLHDGLAADGSPDEWPGIRVEDAPDSFGEAASRSGRGEDGSGGGHGDRLLERIEEADAVEPPGSTACNHRPHHGVEVVYGRAGLGRGESLAVPVEDDPFSDALAEPGPVGLTGRPPDRADEASAEFVVGRRLEERVEALPEAERHEERPEPVEVGPGELAPVPLVEAGGVAERAAALDAPLGRGE